MHTNEEEGRVLGATLYKVQNNQSQRQLYLTKVILVICTKMTVEDTVRGNHEDAAPASRLHVIEPNAHCNSRRSSLKPTLTTVPSGVEMNSEDFEEVRNKPLKLLIILYNF